MLLAIIGTASATACAAVQFPDPGVAWKQSYKDDETIVYAGATDGATGAQALRAFTVISAAPKKVFETIIDFSSYKEYMPYVLESIILKDLPDHQDVAYAYLSFPFISNRDYIILATRSPDTGDGTGAFRYAWTITQYDYPLRRSTVRLTLNTGSWIFSPLDSGTKSLVQYDILTSPGGSIPRAFAQQANTSAIPEVFQAVKRRVADPSWRK